MTDKTVTLEDRRRRIIAIPVLEGSVGPDVVDIRKLYGRNRHVHLRPRLHLDRQLPERDHLYRRRGGHPAPPRLSDRPAGRAVDLHGSRLPAAPRRAAEEGRARQVHLHDQPPHHAARAAGDLLSRLPARRAPDGDHVRRGRRAVGFLSRQHRHHRSAAADDRLAPADRQDADDRGDGLQIFDRPAVPLSGQLPRLHRQFPAHDVRRSGRAL